MESSVNIALDTFTEYEIVDDCITDVSFNIEDLELSVSQGKYIEFGLFTFVDSNGDCRKNFEFKATMFDGSELLPFFRMHNEERAFEIMPHA